MHSTIYVSLKGNVLLMSEYQNDPDFTSQNANGSVLIKNTNIFLGEGLQTPPFHLGYTSALSFSPPKTILDRALVSDLSGSMKDQSTTESSKPLHQVS